MSNTFLWLNDHLLPTDNATIRPDDRGLLLGDGLFETIRIAEGHAWHLPRHFQRFEKGCRLLRLPLLNRTFLTDAITRLITANDLVHGSLRLTLTRGPGPRGLAPPDSLYPTLLITTTAAPQHPARPLTIFLSQTQRRDAHSPLCRIKTLAMLPSLLARYEAQDQGSDDALLCNHQGALAEASAATFLALKGDKLLTPRLEDGPLPGISRTRLLEAQLCQEARLTPHDLPTLNGAWLVTSLSLTPVAAINGQRLPLHPKRHKALSHFLYETNITPY